MSTPVIRVENLWKEYRLGAISHRTLAKDVQSWWARMRGNDDPNAKLSSDFSTPPSSSPPANCQLPTANSAEGGPANCQPPTADSASQREADRFWALKDISFEVNQGEVLGIIGANGAGKSTLLKILSRVTTPTRGQVKIKGRIASLLEVGTGFHPELTGRENVFLNGAILGMTKAEIRSKLDEIIEFAGIEKFIETPVKRYSSGMYVRLAFAVAAHLDPEILIVDEVLAVGDEAFRRKCLGKMQDVAAGGRTVIFVSHNMAAIRHLCSRAVLLNMGRVKTVGLPSEVTEAYHHALAGKSETASTLLPGTLYDEPGVTFENGCAITGLTMLDDSGNPKTSLHTWDRVRFRIAFTSQRRMNRGSVVFQVATREGVVLTLTSTTPDSTLPYAIVEGNQFVDCIFQRWPYAQGDYQLGVGLAVPGVHMIVWNDQLCPVHVSERDVFNSGLAPSSNRYLVAAETQWEDPKHAELATGG